jgi:uncharacterized SAM-binding protein YcdF (DUF218 family)
VAGVLTVGSLLRALEGARVFKMIGARLAIASGGIARPDRQLTPESEMLREAMNKAGVPANLILQESLSKTTLDAAKLIGPMLKAHNVKQFVLVTSPTHMRRALMLFRASGMDPVPSIAPARSEYGRHPPLFLPNDESWQLSDQAVYDYAAWVYNWWRIAASARP